MSVACVGPPHQVLKEETLIRKMSASGKWSDYSCFKSQCFLTKINNR